MPPARLNVEGDALVGLRCVALQAIHHPGRVPHIPAKYVGVPPCTCVQIVAIPGEAHLSSTETSCCLSSNKCHMLCNANGKASTLLCSHGVFCCRTAAPLAGTMKVSGVTNALRLQACMCYRSLHCILSQRSQNSPEPFSFGTFPFDTQILMSYGYIRQLAGQALKHC